MTFPEFNTQLNQAIDQLRADLATIRTGRANPALVEQLLVDSYGTKTPLLQLAAISAPEPRLLVIQPWDPGVIKDIEKAIMASPLGLNPVVDSKLIRLPIPSLTEERRRDLTKLAHEKAETIRIRIRQTRDEIIKHSRQEQKGGQLSEDDLTLLLKNVQREVDQSNVQVDSLVKDKEQEISTI